MQNNKESPLYITDINIVKSIISFDKFNYTLKDTILKYDKTALLYIKLNNLQIINDILIDQIEVSVLHEEMIQTIKNCINPDDIIVSIREDEFCVILKNISYTENTAIIAEEIINAFRRKWFIGNTEFYINVSIGIAFYPDHGNNIKVLAKNARKAMYYTKQKEKNSYKIYHHGLLDSLTKRMKLYISLEKAIEQNELTVYYQPQVSLNTGDIIGVEALARWMHPVKGLILPQYFIPFAEESGLISSISEYVLRTACMQNKCWQEKGYNAFNVSVNFNAVQFQQPGFADMIAGILDDTGMSGEWLNLEITESIPVDNIDIIIDTINKLKKRGITVSLDDFGAGYSSLNYLKHLPIDEIKLDKTFMYDISNEAHHKEIINSVICLAHKLGITVTAEGVETIEQFNFLKDHNCDNAQGFLISKPVSPEIIEGFLIKNM